MRRTLSVDRDDLKPCWVLLKRLFSSRKASSWLAIIFSNIFEIMGRREIGRKFFGSFGSPALNIRTTIMRFHGVWNVSVAVLSMQVRYRMMNARYSLMQGRGILSEPHEEKF